jgi:hypothetical protein
VKAGALVEAEDAVGDDAGLSELHAASVMTADAAQAASASEEEEVRKGFTVVTLQPLSAGTCRWPAVSSATQTFPCPRAPQCPNHKQRLEQESDTASKVRIEPESVCMRGELGDVSGKDDDEEDRDNPSDPHSPTSQHQQAQSKGDFYDARRDDDEVSVQRQPRRHLGVERGPGEAQMTDAGEYQDAAQNIARNASRW